HFLGLARVADDLERRRQNQTMVAVEQRRESVAVSALHIPHDLLVRAFFGTGAGAWALEELVASKRSEHWAEVTTTAHSATGKEFFSALTQSARRRGKLMEP